MLTESIYRRRGEWIKMSELNVGDKVYFLRLNAYIARGLIRDIREDYYVLYQWECLDTGSHYNGRSHILFKRSFSDLVSAKKAKMIKMLKSYENVTTE